MDHRGLLWSLSCSSWNSLKLSGIARKSLDHFTLIQNAGARIQDPGSCIHHSWSRILHPGCKIQDHGWPVSFDAFFTCINWGHFVSAGPLTVPGLSDTRSDYSRLLVHCLVSVSYYFWHSSIISVPSAVYLLLLADYFGLFAFYQHIITN